MKRDLDFSRGGRCVCCGRVVFRGCLGGSVSNVIGGTEKAVNHYFLGEFAKPLGWRTNGPVVTATLSNGGGSFCCSESFSGAGEMGAHKSWWNWAMLAASGVMSAEYVRLALQADMSVYRYVVMVCWIAMFCFFISRIIAGFRRSAGQSVA